MKNNKVKNLLSVILYTFFLVSIAIIFYFNYSLFKRKATLSSDLNELDEKFFLMNDRYTNLEAKISDKELNLYLEEIAREDLNLRKKDEKVLAFPLDSSSTNEVTKNNNKKKKNFLDFIFGN